MNFPKLTDKEEELMHVFWCSDIPLTSNDLLVCCKQHSWRDSYLQVMISSLHEKGLIERVGQKLYRTQYAHQYRSTMSCEEYYIRLAYSRGVDPQKFILLIKEHLKDENKD